MQRAKCQQIRKLANKYTTQKKAYQQRQELLQCYDVFNFYTQQEANFTETLLFSF